jgi:hypothetical protein
MSLKVLPIPPVPEETARVVRACFPHGTLVVQLRDALGARYSDDDFADLFPMRAQSAGLEICPQPGVGGSRLRPHRALRVSDASGGRWGRGASARPGAAAGARPRLAEVAPDWLRAQAQPAWVERYAHRVEAYRLPKSKAEREQSANQIGADGWHLLDALQESATPTWLRELPAVQTLRRVWAQQ